MKSIILAAVLIVSATALPANQDERKNYDFATSPISEIKTIMDCVSDKTPCSPHLQHFRQLYPGVVENACEKCTEAQKCKGYMLFNRVRNELPQEFADFKSKHDPQGKYFDKFFAVLEKSHFEQHPHGH